MIRVNPKKKVGWADKVVKGIVEKSVPRMGVEPMLGEKFVGFGTKRKL